MPHLRTRRLLRFVPFNRHATKHFHATRHPIVTSLETGETWAWCYVDDATLSAE